MLQQWEQMPTQHKIFAVGLLALIIIAVGMMIFLTVRATGRRPIPEAPQIQQQAGGVGQVQPQGGQEMPMMGPPMGAGPGAPMAGGMGLGIGGQGGPGAPGQPIVAIPRQQPQQPQRPPQPSPEKSVEPPTPGRADPFAALKGAEPTVSPEPAVFTPPVTLPPVEETPPSPLTEMTWGTRLATLPSPSTPPQRVTLEPAERPMSLEDPGLRVTGVMVGKSIGAVLELPDGTSLVVRPGQKVMVRGETYTIVRIEVDKVTLRDETGKERVAYRRRGRRALPAVGGAPFRPFPGGAPYGAPGGFGPGF